jgi:anti-sigma regulatory factor (Ser/Thr protein kinase)
VTATHNFRLANDLSEVPSLRKHFEQACRAAGVIDDDINSQALVLTELVNNGIEHGCTRPSDVVEGWYRITDTEIEIEATDPGEVLTVSDFDNADASNFAEEGRGAGLFLVRALTDAVDVRPSPHGGTTVHVTKHRRQGATS